MSSTSRLRWTFIECLLCARHYLNPLSVLSPSYFTNPLQSALQKVETEAQGMTCFGPGRLSVSRCSPWIPGWREAIEAAGSYKCQFRPMECIARGVVAAEGSGCNWMG